MVSKTPDTSRPSGSAGVSLSALPSPTSLSNHSLNSFIILYYPKPCLSRKGERGCVVAVFLAHFLEKGISNYIGHGSIIQVFTVS